MNYKIFETLNKNNRKLNGGTKMNAYNNVEKEIKVPATVKNEFKKLYQNGIYKELHRRKILTDIQLENLLSKNY